MTQKTKQHILQTSDGSEACHVVHQQHVANVQQEFFSPCQIINQHYSLKVLQQHTQQDCQKHPEQLRNPERLKGVNAKG